MKPPFDPILIHFTPTYGIHWYGILIVIGIMAGAWYAAWRVKQDGENPDHVWNGLIVAIIIGIVCARLYHVFSEPEGGSVGWSYYRQNPIKILIIWEGGLGIYGGVLGGTLGVLVYAWRAKLRAWQWLDYGAPGLALGQAIGRWGNFINQELYGPPTNTSRGLLIDAEHRIAPFNDLTTYPLDTLFHPTFLYESLWCLLLFIALALIAHKWKDRVPKGTVAMSYVIGYPLGRFFIEYFRPDAWMIGPLAAAQWFAIVCVIVGVTLLVVLNVRARRAAPGGDLSEAEPKPEEEPEPEEPEA